MINVTQFKNAVQEVCDLILDCNDVIWANQGEHRPQRPYASLLASGPVKTGHDDSSMVGESMVISGPRSISIAVNYFGTDGMQKLSKLQMADEFHWVREDLASDGIVFVSAGEIRDLSELEDAKFSSRFQMDIEFRVKSLVIEENLGYIEATELNTTLDDESFTVGAPLEEEP